MLFKYMKELDILNHIKTCSKDVNFINSFEIILKSLEEEGFSKMLVVLNLYH